MELRFDHAVVVVPDLDEGIRTFAAAGFVVLPGGSHAAIPTRNALIVFADGGYLELLAPRDAEALASLRARPARPGWEADLRRGSAIGRRFLPLLLGPAGVADFVLHGGQLARAAAELRRRGVTLTGPAPMSRDRSDGERLEWELVLPAAWRHPMLIEDRTPRERRVPADAAATAHANGARGVAAVRVRVAGVPPAALEYADLFGVTPSARPDGSAAVRFGELEVVLEEGEPEGAHALELAGVTGLDAAVRALRVLPHGSAATPRERAGR